MNELKIHSSIKKNIRRKHEMNRIQKKNFDFKNLIEMNKTLKMLNDKKTKMFRFIDFYFKANSIQMTKMKIQKNNDKFLFLMQTMSQKYASLFDSKQKKQFIFKSLKMYVQKYLFNVRRRRNSKTNNDSQ